TNASPFVGVSYRPIPWLSLYANYATSFTNQIGTQLVGGGNPDPLLGRQFEGGIKAGTADGRLAGTVSVFEVTQRNVLTASDVPGVSIQTGEVRTRGVEVDVSTELFEGMHTQIAYTYLDAEVTEDTVIVPGTKRLTNSKHNFNLWAEYRPEFAGGFGLGAGVFYVGPRQTSDTGGFTLPEYTRVDASMSYEADDWRATIYLENITNEKYFYTRGPVLAPQAPFTVSLRVAKRF
ncbi:MAG: TonB-dependent receptor, partial [Oxalobacteraceae bacterium]